MMKLNKNLIVSILTWVVVGICILLLIFLLIDAIKKDAHAAELELRTGTVNFTNPDVEDSLGVELLYRPENAEWLHFSVSYSHPTRTHVGQKITDFNLYGIGGGVTQKLGEYLNLDLNIAWYQPVPSREECRKGETEFGDMYEALSTWVEDYYHAPTVPFDRYEYNIDGNLGGGVRLNYDRPLSDKVFLNLGIGYTKLSLHEEISMYMDDGSGTWWHFPRDLDMDHWFIGGGIKFVF